MRRLSRVTRPMAAALGGVVVVALFVAPVGAQRLRSPASSLVLATPTVTCGVSPQVNLSWTDSASSATGTYRVMSNVVGGKQNAWSAGPYLGNVSSTSVGAANGSGWQFAIEALTSVTRDSNVVSITINCPAVDSTAPSVPSITSATALSCSSVALAWTAATDTGGSGLAGYNVFRDGSFVQRVAAPATSWTNTGLAASTAYSFQVSAIDNAGNQSAKSTAVGVTTPACVNQAPHANAGADQSVLTLVTVSFNGSGSTDADGTIASYAWNFGDGTTGTGVTTSHSYASSGVFTVTLTVTDNQGATGSDTAVVTVANRPPVANAGPDQSVVAGSAVNFNGSGSSDADGTIAGYSWNFGDGTTGTGVTTSHTYANAGTYTAALTVTDNKGATATDTAIITVGSVANKPPVANAGVDQSALTLVTLSFNGSGSSDPDGTIASYAWNFGDATTGTGVTVSHSYASSGVYTVTLTVTDNKGATATDTAIATIMNRPPIANAGPDQSATAGTAVSFNGSGSSDPDGTIAGYSWNFGDGTTGTGATTSHAYANAGTYTAALTVTDNKGATTTDTAVVAVSAVSTSSPQLLGYLPGVGTARDVRVAGSIAYVASEQYGLSVVDVTNAAAPVVRGVSDVRFFGEFVAVAGTRAVVAGTSSLGTGLWVFDVTDPTAPHVVGTLMTTSVTTFNGVALNGTGSVAVVSLGTSGIWTVDLSVPSAPAHVGTYDTTGTAYGVAVSGTTAYVADGAGGLVLINIANPSAPALLGSKTYAGHSFFDVAVSGSVAYATDTTWLFFGFDVSVPSAPTLRGSLTLPGPAYRLSVAGNYAVIGIGLASTGDSLGLIDVSAATPRLVTTTGLGTSGTTSQIGMFIAGTRAYAADGMTGVAIFDVTSTAVSRVGTAANGFAGDHVAAVNGIAVVAGNGGAAGSALLEVVNVTTPDRPRVVGTLTAAVPGFGDVAINATGTLAAVSLGTSGVWLIDLTVPSAPVHVGTFDSAGTAAGLTISGTTLYVADGSGGLVLVSIANPSAPALLGSKAFAGQIFFDVVVNGNLAYVSASTGLFFIFDVSVPSAPVTKGSLTLPGPGYQLAVSGTRAAVTTSLATGDTLLLIDVSSPTAPVLRSQIATGSVGISQLEGVGFTATRVYIAADFMDLKIFDISTLTAPTAVGSVATAGNAHGMAIVGGTAYITDASASMDVVGLGSTL